MMGAYESTTPPNASCVPSRSGAATGLSPSIRIESLLLGGHFVTWSRVRVLSVPETGAKMPPQSPKEGALLKEGRAKELLKERAC
jgi:hypothetical protein